MELLDMVTVVSFFAILVMLLFFILLNIRFSVVTLRQMWAHRPPMPIREAARFYFEPLVWLFRKRK